MHTLTGIGMLRGGLLRLLALVLLGCWLAAPVPAEAAKKPKVRALVLMGATAMDAATGQQNGWQGKQLKVSGKFSVESARDVYFYVYWKGLTGEHYVTAKLYSPDGRMYQQRVLPISIGAPVSPTRSVPGLENPVEVQQTTRAGTINVTTLQLPIAGTWITEHRLLGKWTVEIFLNNDAAPVTSGTFMLTD